jgi:hypothetical protein
MEHWYDWLHMCATDEATPCVSVDQLAFIAISVVFLVAAILLARRARDFSTATLSLMPAAIAINIAAGSLMYALRLPLYLDSVGTVLVGVLAGPWAGAMTGILANFIWSFLPIPGGAGPIGAAFAPVAGVIGLMAGLWARSGILRVRAHDERTSRRVAIATFAWGWLVAGGLLRLLFAPNGYFSTVDGSDPKFLWGADLTGLTLADQAGLYLTWGTGALIGLILGYVIYRRHLVSLFPVWLAGGVTGIMAATISAPIAAYVYGGVTGGGTDAIVALFRSAGLSIFQASFAQGLTSDPLDKTISFTVVFFILAALPLTVKTLFPRGEQVVAPSP